MISMIFFGLALGLLAAYGLHRLNDSQTARNLATVGHRMSPDSYSGSMWHESDIGPYLFPSQQPQRPLRAQPVTILEGQFRDYPYGVDTMKRQTRTTGKQTIRKFRSLNLGDATTANGPIEIETRQPNRKPDTQADVAVPAMQALISATIAALLAGMLALLANRADVFKIMGGSFVIVLAVAWIWRLGVSDRLLEVIERITQTDIDKNGQVGSVGDSHTMLENPGQAREEVSQVVEDHSRKASTAAMLAFWTKCVNVGTSTRNHGAKPGTRALEDYEAARDTLMQLGLAKWRNESNHRGGWDVTTDLETGARIIAKHVRDMRNRHN